MTRLRDRLDLRTRHRLALARVRTRQVSGHLRLWPDFLVIGAQRCGTSSLYRYLGAHPDVTASVRKEVEWFSSYPLRPASWYRAHFPLSLSRGWHLRRRGRARQTFEATPDYLFHPSAPGRVLAALPDIRCVVLLRDPVERAWSHYRHMRRLGLEPLSFADALRVERRRVEPDLARSERDPSHRPVDALRYSYVARGQYANQLERWMAVLPPERLLVVDSHRLFADPRTVVREICAFLDLEVWAPAAPTNHSHPVVDLPAGSDATQLPDEARSLLSEAFVEANVELGRLLTTPLSFLGAPSRSEPAHLRGTS